MYLDYCLRTDNGAHSAACTFGVVCLRREETVFIGVIRDDDAVFRTYHCAQAATFAPFGINNYFTSHLRFLHCVLCKVGSRFRSVFLFSIFLLDFSRDGCACKVKRRLTTLNMRLQTWNDAFYPANGLTLSFVIPVPAGIQIRHSPCLSAIVVEKPASRPRSLMLKLGDRTLK